MVRQWQTLFYDGRYAGTPMKNPDFGAIAGAYRIPYLQVTELEAECNQLREQVS